jgi:hypothetical protein
MMTGNKYMICLSIVARTLHNFLHSFFPTMQWMDGWMGNGRKEIHHSLIIIIIIHLSYSSSDNYFYRYRRPHLPFQLYTLYIRRIYTQLAIIRVMKILHVNCNITTAATESELCMQSVSFPALSALRLIVIRLDSHRTLLLVLP